MLRQGALDTAAPDTAPNYARRETHPAVARIEDVRIRNYDPTEHRLSLIVTDSDGVALDERFAVTPEATVSLIDRLDDGRYDVSAVMDRRRRATARCEVTGRPGGTILVELGNGIVSVSNGL